MRNRRIGDVKVSAIGFGAMRLSIPGRPERDDAISTIHAALDAGITLIDTSDAYTTETDGPGHNETLIAEALIGRSEEVLVATKGGLIFRDGGPWDRVGSPEHLHQAARASAKRLGVDAIGLYQFHRPDPSVPYEDSIGALRELHDEGVIRMVGISNADVDQIRIADRELGSRLVSVQNRFALDFRSSESEMDHCAQHEIAFLPWGPLGGTGPATDIGDRFPVLDEIAGELEASPQQVALAWQLALQHTVIPIPGGRRASSVRDSALAADLVLTAGQIERLSA